MSTKTEVKNETTVRTEWGVEKTWPDGHVEYSREDSRDSAEHHVWIGTKYPKTPARLRTVTRTVTTTPWTPVS